MDIMKILRQKHAFHVLMAALNVLPQLNALTVLLEQLLIKMVHVHALSEHSLVFLPMMLDIAKNAFNIVILAVML